MHVESWVINKRGEKNIDIETPERVRVRKSHALNTAPNRDHHKNH